MTEAIIYTRFSPRKNGEKSTSNETQHALCRDYAYDKGYEVIGHYQDREISGSTVHKPGLANAIAHLPKEGVLLVYKRDRIARDVFLAELARRQVKAKGGKIEAVKGDIEGDGPYVKMARQVMDAVAELERHMISERTRDAMIRHQKEGRRMSRHPPFGMMVDPNDKAMLAPNPDEQRAIERIMDLHIRGRAVYKITQVLNDEMPEVARGSKWWGKTVKKVIEERENDKKRAQLAHAATSDEKRENNRPDKA